MPNPMAFPTRVLGTSTSLKWTTNLALLIKARCENQRSKIAQSGQLTKALRRKRNRWRLGETVASVQPPLCASHLSGLLQTPNTRIGVQTGQSNRLPHASSNHTEMMHRAISWLYGAVFYFILSSFLSQMISNRNNEYFTVLYICTIFLHNALYILAEYLPS